ncbi:hypothetical protein B9Z55_005696 [Caenorhabditis nigoni]|nr:hypothetical protein B9Z55_005696 [Caenorhabditis nigoni]
MIIERRRSQKLYHGDKEPIIRWQPSMGAVIKLLLSIRISGALWSVIRDTDETYNFWEALHSLTYHNSSSKWECPPTHTSRSYFFLWLHSIPSSFFADSFGQSKIVVFTLVRLTIGIACLAGEYYAFDSISKRINVSTGRYFLIFSAFSSGMFHASVTLTPYTFSMICSFFYIGAYLNEKNKLSMFFWVMSVTIGSPHTAVFGLTLLLNFLYYKKKDDEIKKQDVIPVAIFAVVATLATSSFEMIYYGFAHSARRGLLWTDFTNGHSSPQMAVISILDFISNWNTASFLAVVGPYLSYKVYRKYRVPAETAIRYRLPNPIDQIHDFFTIFNLARDCFFWFASFALLSRKFERFMFPIYPHVALFAALACDAIPRLLADDLEEVSPMRSTPTVKSSRHPLSTTPTSRFSRNPTTPRTEPTRSRTDSNTETTSPLVPEPTDPLVADNSKRKSGVRIVRIVVGMFVICSFLRVYSSHQSYGSEMDIYKGLHEELNAHEEFGRFNDPIRLCLGKAWKRFPSSFFIPSEAEDGKGNSRKVEMKFLDFEYTGISPKSYKELKPLGFMLPYGQCDVKAKNAALSSCDYVIDIDKPSTKKNHDFREMPEQWKRIISLPYLDEEKSHPLMRHFSIPFFSSYFNQIQFTTISLYRKVVQ